MKTMKYSCKLYSKKNTFCMFSLLFIHLDFFLVRVAADLESIPGTQSVVRECPLDETPGHAHTDSYTHSLPPWSNLS